MTKYKPGAYDSNGIEYLKDGYVTAMFYYDATDDYWSAPGVDFYGAGRDGYWYINGIRSVSPSDGGTFSDGYCWGKTGDLGLTGSYQSGYGGVVCSGNTATLSLVNGASFNPKLGSSISSSYRWFFPGNQDIDIEVDWANWSQTGGSFFASLLLGSNERDYEYITIYYGNYSHAVFAGGSFFTIGTQACVQASGKIRIVKTAGTTTTATYTTYFWNGASWVTIGTNSNVAAANLSYASASYVALYVWGNVGGAGSIDFSNFVINAGTALNRPGWTQSASNGDNYCLGGEFPEKSLIIGTSDNATDTASQTINLTIINTETDEVWLNHAENNAINFYTVSPRIKGVSMANGDLSVSTDCFDGSGNHPPQSELTNISFTKDLIRKSFYDFFNFVGTGGNNWGYNDNVAGGSIYSSLIGKSEIGPALSQFALINFTSFREKNNLCFSCDGYSYKSVVMSQLTQAPRVVIMRTANNQVYPQFSTAVPAMCEQTNAVIPGPVHWDGSIVVDDNNDLFILAKGVTPLNDFFIYKSLFSEYNSAFGSTFSITEAYGGALSLSVVPIGAIGGACSLDSQARSLSILNNILYYSADEGIYFVNWNVSTGFIYGKSGSGASHEILPAYDKITALSSIFADSKNLLIATAVNGTDYYNFIINIDSNSLLSSVDITSDIVTQPSAVSSGV